MIFPEKFKKILNKGADGFMDEADSFDVERLKAEIVAAEKNIYIVDKEKEENEDLKAKKEVLKSILGAYSEAKKIQAAKMQYCLALLESKGEIDSTTRVTET